MEIQSLYDGLIKFDHCPFCACSEFYHGPEGAGSVNIKCVYCGATFNDMGSLGIQALTWPEKSPFDFRNDPSHNHQINAGRAEKCTSSGLLDGPCNADNCNGGCIS